MWIPLHKTVGLGALDLSVLGSAMPQSQACKGTIKMLLLHDTHVTLLETLTRNRYKIWQKSYKITQTSYQQDGYEQRNFKLSVVGKSAVRTQMVTHKFFKHA